MENLIKRFVKYAKVHTTSSEDSETVPSTEIQKDLGKILVEDLKEIGLSDAYMDDKGYVYATLKSNTDKNLKKIGFIAHMDTSPDMSGENVKPRIIENYDGSDIILNEKLNIHMGPNDFESLNRNIGENLIVTDGTTLLGADDKAGIAEIMTMLETIIQKNLPHGDIKIAFTPDEEVGRGTDHFNVKAFDADFAYTVDGGEVEFIDYENFNAASAVLDIQGLSIHPGSAKGKMINALLVGMEFHSMLPVEQNPAYTEGYEGFNHLHSIQGTCEETVAEYIIRNHDLQQANKQCQDFKDIAEFLNKKYGYKIVEVTITESYLNMKEALKDHMFIVEQALAAIKENGLDAYCSPIRGGTDGARLTFKGLPCPNLGTGGFNYHGPYEYCSLTMMEKQVQILLHILKNTASK